ncbi:Vacuolar protein 8 [Merluccius polli]|uniref:Vacuolar protein 8 n=1 Tax=Merluccius polli TaxID=89951 RepID=A0AA47MFZ1_MERPO|nr:Vacuolar protein 8 [Merluccius polli]
MDSALCEKCALLWRKFKVSFRNVCKEVSREVEVFFAALCACTCLHNAPESRRSSRRSSRLSHHLVPLWRTGDQTHALHEERVEVLNDLAASGDGDLQQAAAAYYLYLSHQVASPLPDVFMEPLVSLLLSPHADVQKTACLSLVNLLVKRNACEELLCEMGTLPPLLEMIRCGDTAARCHACACVTMLASSECNSDALVSEAVIPLLALAKSYDPQVQQNAAWVLLSLTQSGWSRRVLCGVGAVPVLAVLLQSSDSRVQFYGGAALCSLAADGELRGHLLRAGERRLLQALLTLMSSPVHKNACQACECIQMFCRNVVTPDQLMDLDWVWPLKTLLASSVLDCVQSGLRLLCVLSGHPANQEVLVSEGVLDVIGQTLQRHRSSGDVITLSCSAVRWIHCYRTLDLGVVCDPTESKLTVWCLWSQALMGQRALVSPVGPEDSLVRLTACLLRLMSCDALQSYLSATMTSEEVLRLVKLSRPNGNLQLTYNCIAIIGKLHMNGEVLVFLRPHHSVLMGNILAVLKNQEVEFQHLGITTLCHLMKGSLILHQSVLGRWFCWGFDSRPKRYWVRSPMSTVYL